MWSPFTRAADVGGSSGRQATANRINDLAWLAAQVFLVAIPATSVWVLVSGHDYSRVSEIALCLICALAVALWGSHDAAAAPPRWPTAAVAALALVATLHAPNLRMATRELTLLLGLASLAWLTARRPGQDLAHLLAVVVIASAAYTALVGLGLVVFLSAAVELQPFNLLIGYDNGRFFNHVQTSMLPLLVLATLHPHRSRWIARLAWFGLVGELALLALSEGRATGLALVVGATAGGLLLRASAWCFARNLAIGAAAAAVVYALLFIALPSWLGMPVQALHIDGVADTGSAHSRFILWRLALDGIRTSPWLGIGPMHFSHTWNSDAAHPHNVYLQVAEEWGVPMLLLLLGIAFFALRRLYRAVRDHRGAEADRRVGLVLFTTLIAIAVDGCLSGNFVMPVSQVWIAVVAGAAIGWVRRTSPSAPVAPTRAVTLIGRGLRWVPLAAMLWLTASIAPELGTHFLDRPGPPGTSRDAGAPRFWSNGWF